MGHILLMRIVCAFLLFPVILLIVFGGWYLISPFKDYVNKQKFSSDKETIVHLSKKEISNISFKMINSVTFIGCSIICLIGSILTGQKVFFNIIEVNENIKNIIDVVSVTGVFCFWLPLFIILSNPRIFMKWNSTFLIRINILMYSLSINLFILYVFIITSFRVIE